MYLEDGFTENPMSKAAIILESTDKHVLFVEGHSDRIYFKAQCESKRCSIVDCNGRDNLCEALDTLSAEHGDRILGICDRDFLTFGIGNHNQKSILLTDYHDLELDAYKYGNLSSQLNMRFSDTKLNTASQTVNDALDMAMNISLPTSYLRYLNEAKNMRIDFNHHDFKGLDLNWSREKQIKFLVNSVLKQTKNTSHLNELPQILDEVEKLIDSDMDDLQICNGHELVLALVQVDKKFKKNGYKDNTESEMQDLLLGSYPTSPFRRSNLGRDLLKIYKERLKI